jgi:hypothetical protein
VWTDYEVDYSNQTGTQSFLVYGGAGLGGPHYYAQIYDFGISLDSERSLPLSPNVFFTSAAQSLYFRNVMRTTNTDTDNDITNANELLSIGFVDDSAPELWSASNLPSNADVVTIEANMEAPGEFFVLSENGVQYDINIPLDFNTEYDSRPARSIKTVLSGHDWNGRLAFAWENSFGFAPTIEVTVEPEEYENGFLAGQYVPFTTGWLDHPASRGRPVNDMKTGLPAFAEDLVEDQYVHGIWTSGEQWDPDDPRNIRQVRFPRDEGTKKDDVPV